MPPLDVDDAHDHLPPGDQDDDHDEEELGSRSDEVMMIGARVKPGRRRLRVDGVAHRLDEREDRAGGNRLSAV